MVAELPRQYIDVEAIRTQVKRLAEQVGLHVIDRKCDQRVEDATSDPPLKTIAQAWVHALRARNATFPRALFADPAWNMLLDLYLAKCDDKEISVSSVCIAASVPATTALRWIGTLEKHGLVVSDAHPWDGRKRLVRISNTGATLVETALGRAAHGDRRLGLGRLHAIT